MWKESSTKTHFVLGASDKYAGYFLNSLHKSAKVWQKRV